MALTAFNMIPYNASTNPKGYEILEPSELIGATEGVYEGDTGAGGYVDPTSPSGGSIPAAQVITSPDYPVVTGVSATTSFKVRIRRVDDPDDTASGWLVDPRGCRFINSDNTGANTSGNTLVTDAARFTDGQFIFLQKINKETNEIVTANVDATITGEVPVVAVGDTPTYIDITLNPKPVNDGEGELDRTTTFKYRLVLRSELPSLKYTATGIPD